MDCLFKIQAAYLDLPLEEPVAAAVQEPIAVGRGLNENDVRGLQEPVRSTTGQLGGALHLGGKTPRAAKPPRKSVAPTPYHEAQPASAPAPALGGKTPRAAKPPRKSVAPNPYEEAQPAPAPALAQRAQAAARVAISQRPATPATRVPAKEPTPAPAKEPAHADARAEGPTEMANMAEAVALMRKLGDAERARAFKVGQQQR